MRIILELVIQISQQDRIHGNYQEVIIKQNKQETQTLVFVKKKKCHHAKEYILVKFLNEASIYEKMSQNM